MISPCGSRKSYNSSILKLSRGAYVRMYDSSIDMNRTFMTRRCISFENSKIIDQ